MDGPGFGIVDHRLAGIRFQPSPNHGGLLSPRLGLIHYTGGSSLSAAVDHLCDSASKVSAHVVIGVDGKIVQLVPFNLVAWHAGDSEYNGVPHCNSFAIGIELVNSGYLAATGIQARHKSGGPMRTWAIYPEVQIRACAQVCSSLSDQYGIKEWVGHDDVAPGRKVDPGPAWDWTHFRSIESSLRALK